MVSKSERAAEIAKKHSTDSDFDFDWFRILYDFFERENIWSESYYDIDLLSIWQSDDAWPPVTEIFELLEIENDERRITLSSNVYSFISSPL